MEPKMNAKSGGEWFQYDRHTQPLEECMRAIRTFYKPS